MKVRKRIHAVSPVWLTVFSDLVTNLTLFFMMLFITQLLSAKQRAEAFDSMSKTFLKEGTSEIKKIGDKDGLGDVREKWIDLDSKLESIEDFKIIKIRLQSDILFKIGSATLKKEALVPLDMHADLIKDAFSSILIAGHTDNLPIIKGSPYKTNWELSMMRSYFVAEYLKNRYNINPSRIISVGYSYYHPLFPNDTAEHRAKNRRVEIKIIKG